MNNKCNNWDQMVNSVVFSMNNSVNSSMGYSPFEIIFGQRPKFPLSADKYSLDLKSLPKDLHSYLERKEQVLNSVRQDVKDHLIKSKEDMLNRANDKVKMLQVTKGDYVYLHDLPSGSAKKLRNYYSGPYIVETITSPHTVLLLDPSGIKSFTEPVHIERIKMASVRMSEPLNFFKVITRTADISTVSTSCQTEDLNPDSNEPVLTETPLTTLKSLNIQSEPVLTETPSTSVKSLNHQKEPVNTETPSFSVKSLKNQNEPVNTETPFTPVISLRNQKKPVYSETPNSP